MFNNITNFFNLIVGRKIKNAATVEDTDLVPLGTRDPRFLGDYQPTAISVQDLQTAIGFNGVAVDGVTIIGDGTNVNPLQATASSGVQVVLFADLATTAALKPCTYNNGVAGVGATLTGNSNGQLSTVNFTDKIDGVTTALGQIILVRAQSNQIQNGLYLVTQLGDALNPFILTRTVDADTQAELYPVQINVFSGVSYPNYSFLQKTVNPIIGTDPIVFTTTALGLTFNPVQMVDTVTIAALPACTYTDGPNAQLPGSGAALTANASGAIGTINGTLLTNGMRILVRNQVNAAHNGDYTVASQGSAGSPWKLVRSTVWGSNFTRLQREWKVNNSTSGSYGARYSVNIASLANVNVGITPLVFVEILPSGLPPWIEYNGAELTLWCNGQGNISTNTSYGDRALASNTTGSLNTAIGNNALKNNLNGANNVGIGYEALLINVSGTDNTAVGSGALAANSTGGGNVAIGKSALLTNTSGISNTAVGLTSLRANTIGLANTAIGDSSLQSNTSGQENTAVGYAALQAQTTGNTNTAIGAYTVSGNFTGSTILGYGATATGNNQFVVGSAGVNAGTVTNAAAAQTHYWTVKINGTDYKILLGT